VTTIPHTHNPSPPLRIPASEENFQYLEAMTERFIRHAVTALEPDGDVPNLLLVPQRDHLHSQPVGVEPSGDRDLDRELLAQRELPRTILALGAETCAFVFTGWLSTDRSGNVRPSHDPCRKEVVMGLVQDADHRWTTRSAYLERRPGRPPRISKLQRKRHELPLEQRRPGRMQCGVQAGLQVVRKLSDPELARARWELRDGLSAEALLVPYDSLMQPPHEQEATAGTMPDAGRNDPCPCGSGRKFKHCCLL
jgi:hypothetical protein